MPNVIHSFSPLSSRALAKAALFAGLLLTGCGNRPPVSKPPVASKPAVVKPPMRPGNITIRPVSLGSPLTAQRIREEKTYRVMECGDPRKPEIALTFDDGPHPEFAPKLMKRLHELNVKATFFVVGERVEEYPDIVARLKKEGHEIGSHTYTHQNLRRLPLDKIDDEISKANIAIRKATGQFPVFMRPPGGQYDDAVLQISRKHGLITALWTENPADYAAHSSSEIENMLLKRVHNGSIVLLHSGVENTYLMLPSFVTTMRNRGYKFVTMSQLTRPLQDPARVAQR